jgi:Sulfotransferase domain
MKRIYSTLGIEVDEGQLQEVVERHSWENIPEDQKGQGKFYRKASPGGWREDLTPEQAEIIEKVTAPLLEKYYPPG